MTKQMPDVYLMALEVIAEQSDGTPNRNSTGMTIASNGVVYSGNLISEEKWLKEVLEKVLHADTPGSRVLTQVFSDARDKLKKAEEFAENDGKFEEFLHLVDAKVMTGSSFTSVPPVRIKKSSVTAWSFGVFN